MFRSRSWFGSGGLWKPKNPHSLEHLKYLYNVLSKNQTVNEQNRGLLVETLRSIAEILIWGDQNDSTVFDFFLEKNMLSFFLKIMKQKCGSYVCVQLLQTLNILFENIRNETSLYYLLSNNHVNSIIVHKFDFSDEEVMAYYISFLKTLSLKLNSHTIHFFYNEHTHDFPLYTEAIKFFNNGESMVRIAVRTLTLNVYRIHDKSMLKFIRDKTAAPYFSNLVWFIGNHVYELDASIRDNVEREARIKLADLVAEHLDHLHYLNDILCLEIDSLNQVLTEHLLHRLLVPLYVASLDKSVNTNTEVTGKPSKVSSILALFLLSQVFLIMTHGPLVRLLANILINGNEGIFEFKAEASPPKLRLSTSTTSTLSSISINDLQFQGTPPSPREIRDESNGIEDDRISSSSSEATLDKLKALEGLHYQKNPELTDLSTRLILTAILNTLDASENDYAPLFALCLLHAIHDNAGIDPELIKSFFYGGQVGESSQSDPNQMDRSRPLYNVLLVDRLIAIICLSVKYESKVRVITLQLLSSLLLRLVMRDGTTSVLEDRHLALIEGAREENILLLQNYYKLDELFLEVFEDEYLEMSGSKSLSIEHLMMDSNLLLPPVGSPLTGVGFDKRLPCGEVERSRRSIRLYFLLRKLSLTLRSETEKYLPLTNPQNCVHIEENLDLSNSDMLSCIVVTDSSKTRRFLVLDIFQLLLVDPCAKQIGWGVVKFVGFLQDIDVLGDKDDSRCLHITVKTSPTSQRGSTSKGPVLVAKFVFDDNIRCMAAKQRLVKGKHKARQAKLHLIAKLLDLSGSTPSPQFNPRRPNRRAVSRSDRSLYTPISRTLPGVAIAVKTDNSLTQINYAGRRRSRESSPSLVSRSGSIQEEEIPLGNIGGTGHPRGRHLTSTKAMSDTHVIAGGSSNQGNLTRLDLEGNRSKVVNMDTTTGANQSHSTPQLQIPPPPPVVSTPQTETSFMTLTSTSSNLESGRRKKGEVETV